MRVAKPAEGPKARLVAQKIVELDQRGVRDAATLRAMMLSSFKYE
jgi:hypothetical protein